MLVAAYVPSRIIGGHSSNSLLGPYLGPSTSCSSYRYPAGAEYRFEGCWAGHPLGWGRCATLAVEVNPTNAPPGWSFDVENGLNQLSRATGLRFRRSTGGADITIGWTQTMVLRANGRPDRAGVTYLATQQELTSVSLRSANIQISSMLSGGSGPNGELPVILHELGHAVGLAHFQGPEEMNPVDQGYPSYQPGDLAGFAALYGGGSCA